MIHRRNVLYNFDFRLLTILYSAPKKVHKKTRFLLTFQNDSCKNKKHVVNRLFKK